MTNTGVMIFSNGKDSDCGNECAISTLSTSQVATLLLPLVSPAQSPSVRLHFDGVIIAVGKVITQSQQENKKT